MTTCCGSCWSSASTTAPRGPTPTSPARSSPRPDPRHLPQPMAGATQVLRRRTSVGRAHGRAGDNPRYHQVSEGPLGSPPEVVGGPLRGNSDSVERSGLGERIAVRRVTNAMSALGAPTRPCHVYATDQIVLLIVDWTIDGTGLDGRPSASKAPQPTLPARQRRTLALHHRQHLGTPRELEPRQVAIGLDLRSDITARRYPGGGLATTATARALRRR
jgi:hypothetical protein